MSQQAAELRLPSHGDIQINCVSDPVYGLGKRTGTDHVHHLPSLHGSPNMWASWISRDSGEKYVLFFEGHGVRIFGLDGFEFPCLVQGNALSYLDSRNPRRDLFSLSLADTTLVLNRGIVPAMTDTNKTAAVTPLAVVFVKQGNYGQDYKVTFGGVTYSYTTSTTDVTKLATSYIAAQLVAAIGAPAGYTINYTSGDSHFTVNKNDNTAFDIETRDSVANSVLDVVKNATDSFDRLPPIAPNGYICKITGSADSDADDYWVKFDATTKPGEWVECVAPNTQIDFDSATMPHKIERLEDDDLGTNTGRPEGIYFRLAPVTWNSRISGDTSSVPVPSFIGRPIRSLYLHQNRFGFLMDDRIVMSKVGDFFNFWRQTSTKVLDSDTIDVTVSVGRLADDRVLNLRHALSFNEQLLLVGDRAQITVFASEALTPGSIRAALSTSLEASPDCAPVSVAGNALIPFEDGMVSGLREYFVQVGSQIKDSDLLSRDVPRLMQGSAVQLSVCTLTSTAFMATSSFPSVLFVYRWLVQNQQKIQSSWGWWDFGDPILAFEVLGSTLWLIINRPDGPCLESLEIPAWNKTETEAPFPILLDRKTPCGSANPWGFVSTRGAGQVGGPSGPSLPPSPGGGGGGGPNGGSGGGSDVTPFPGNDGESSHDLLTPPDSGSGGASSGGIVSARERCLATYNSATNQTQIIMPWAPTSETVVVIADTMETIQWTPGNGDTVILVRGDVTQRPVYIGNTYEARFRYGPAAIHRQTPSGGFSTVRTGRLQVIRWQVTATNTGPFDMEVRVDGRTIRTKRIVPKRVGGPNSAVLRPALGAVLVLSRADKARVDLVSRSHWPSWFISAEWSGEYFRSDQPI